MRYITLIFLLILLSMLMGHGIFRISMYIGLGNDHSSLMSFTSGIFIGATLWIWAALDKGRDEE